MRRQEFPAKVKVEAFRRLLAEVERLRAERKSWHSSFEREFRDYQKRIATLEAERDRVERTALDRIEAQNYALGHLNREREAAESALAECRRILREAGGYLPGLNTESLLLLLREIQSALSRAAYEPERR